MAAVLHHEKNNHRGAEWVVIEVVWRIVIETFRSPFPALVAVENRINTDVVIDNNRPCVGGVVAWVEISVR